LGVRGHMTSIMGSGVVEEMAAAMAKAELEWAKAIVAKIVVAARMGDGAGYLDQAAREIVYRRFAAKP